MANKNITYKGAAEKGGYKPLAIWITVMGATVGVGDVAGAATTIHKGGSGAIFWMWISALIRTSTRHSR